MPAATTDPTTPLEDLGELPTGVRDPLAILLAQNATRLPDLVPVRMGRMLESPFAYYRGTAATMAADFATTPGSGVTVLSSGDAHISNFGFFASPERSLLFDLNDFDEAGMAPWEWDVKRLVASVFIVAIDNGGSRKEARQAARSAGKAYARWMVRLADDYTTLERLYLTVDTSTLEKVLRGRSRSVLDKTTTKARRRTAAQVLDKLTVADDHGRRRIVDQPPLMMHTTNVSSEQIDHLWRDYLASTQDAVRYLLSGFRVIDHVLRVVGVGSVGTRAFIIYLEGTDGAPLFLQAKEAQPSVLGTYGGVEQVVPGGRDGEVHSQGQRVVTAQRILQSHSDPFLGWLRTPGDAPGDGAGDRGTDYYWRQFRDMKGSVDLSTLGRKELTATARVCAGLLARAHSQSPGYARIADLCRDADRLGTIFARFADGYERISRADYDALAAAAHDGRVPVSLGV